MISAGVPRAAMKAFVRRDANIQPLASAALS